MSQDKLPLELQFRQGDVVKMVQLKSKKKWNGKLATIIGSFNTEKKRWPIKINFDDEAQALLQPKNLRSHKQGNGWIIDPKSPVQRLNLLLKSYTRDLEAFSKLTRRQKKIFNDDFKYEMHDNIVCNGLSDFDKTLNVLKSTIIKLSEADPQQQAEKFLIDDTQVMTLDDDLSKFHVIVSINIGNNQIWKRITEVNLDKKTKLISLVKIISIEVVDDPKAKKSTEKQGNDSTMENKGNDNTKNVDMNNIFNAIHNKPIDNTNGSVDQQNVEK